MEMDGESSGKILMRVSEREEGSDEMTCLKLIYALGCETVEQQPRLP